MTEHERAMHGAELHVLKTRLRTAADNAARAVRELELAGRLGHDTESAIDRTGYYRDLLTDIVREIAKKREVAR